MRDTKVYDLISHLDRREQSQCLRFIKSPYFNASKQLITLYNMIVKDINNDPVKPLTKEKAWKKLKPNQTYDDVRFRKFASDLSKLIESYLVQINLEENPFRWNLNLVESSEKRRIQKLYNSSIRRIKNASEDKNLEDADFYLEQYLIEKNIFEVMDSDTKRGKRANLEAISHNLDHFYIGQKLKLFCDAKSRQNIKEFSYDLNFQHEIIRYIERTPELPPAIKVYYQIYLIYSKPEVEDNYYKLKELLNQHALKFDKKDARDELYLAAQNYCIQKINKGIAKFLEELFELYQDMVSKEILFVNDELQPWVFR
ncbi:MAG: hypothetical protein AAF705_17890, partial [Bacteroidota bacterium]